jgi:hypothetical protein
MTEWKEGVLLVGGDIYKIKFDKFHWITHEHQDAQGVWHLNKGKNATWLPTQLLDFNITIPKTKYAQVFVSNGDMYQICNMKIDHNIMTFKWAYLLDTKLLISGDVDCYTKFHPGETAIKD